MSHKSSYLLLNSSLNYWSSIKTLFVTALLCLLIIPFDVSAKNDLPPPPVLLAKKFHSKIDLSDYWVSEKLDGVRAIWNGKNLISRAGNIFHAPPWFIQALPPITLDGELWISRGKFETVSGIVRRKFPNPKDWQAIKYMIFDMPDKSISFNLRLMQLQRLVSQINEKHIKLIPQFKISDHRKLLEKLEEIVKNGGEGLMLHAGSSHYRAGRSHDLLKLKKFSDAEAVVIQHIAGKGKYTNMLGAILVETPNKIRFKIGSGFSDHERKNPPVIGATITYRYTGLSKNNVPKFASYLRIRHSQ